MRARFAKEFFYINNYAKVFDSVDLITLFFQKMYQKKKYFPYRLFRKQTGVILINDYLVL